MLSAAQAGGPLAVTVTAEGKRAGPIAPLVISLVD